MLTLCAVGAPRQHHTVNCSLHVVTTKLAHSLWGKGVHLAQDGKEMHCMCATKSLGTHSSGYNKVPNFTYGQWTMKEAPTLQQNVGALKLLRRVQ